MNTMFIRVPWSKDRGTVLYLVACRQTVQLQGRAALRVIQENLVCGYIIVNVGINCVVNGHMWQLSFLCNQKSSRLFEAEI